MNLLKYRWKEMSLSESYQIRSLAILMIVMHNFLHLVMNMPSENEFDYNAAKFQSFFYGLWETPSDFVRITFSYLGHYGVQVFFFLSGYGVAMKYRHSVPSWWSFVSKRLITLYPAVLIAACGFLLYDGIRIGGEEVIAQEGLKLLRQIIGISNFIPSNIYYPIGPWWFIGVIVQFYLLVPFIIRQKIWKQSSFLLGIMASSILLEYFIGPIFMRQFSLNINHTILGHLDVCCLGIFMARYKDVVIPRWAFLTAGILFMMGNLDGTLWICAALAMTILLIPLLRILADKLGKNPFLHRSMLYLGTLSMYIFLCNGYLRKPFLGWAQNDPVWWKSILLCAVFLCLALGWSIMLRAVEQIFKRLISARNG